MMELKQIGVVGCGLMGSGIAEVCARAGYQVTVREINEALLQKGLGHIQKSLGKAVARSKITQEQADQALANIQGTVDLADFADCDLVVEAAVENMDIKKDVFAKLDKIAKPLLVYIGTMINFLDRLANLAERTKNRLDFPSGFHGYRICRDNIKRVGHSNQNLAVLLVDSDKIKPLCKSFRHQTGHFHINIFAIQMNPLCRKVLC